MVAGIFGSSKKNWNLLFIEQGCFRDNAAELLLLFPLGRVEDELTSSWRRSRSQSRNSKASCCEFPRNWAPYL